MFLVCTAVLYYKATMYYII